MKTKLRKTKYDIRHTSDEPRATSDGFTLVEVLIVTVLIGVLAAIVVPSFSNSTTPAKESALATDLQLFRRFILIYKAHHLEVGPGYSNGDTTASPSEDAFVAQATMASKANGQTAAAGTAGYERGPYMQRIPINPFNGKSDIQMLANGEEFPADADDSHGWIYKADTAEIRADCTGTDSNGTRYYEY
jgi:general secretion pathway protein G